MTECFTIYADEVENRIDPHFYRPEFWLIKNLEKSKWKTLKLGDLIEKINYGASVKAYPKGEIPFLRIQNLQENKVKLDNLVYAKKSELMDSDYVNEGDFLISRSGTIGVVARVPKEADKFAFGSFMIRFRLKEDKNINPKYISLFLNSRLGKLQTTRSKTGGLQGNITIPAIKNIRIPLPPLEIQDKIVALMDKAYSLKRFKESEAEKLLDSINNHVLNELGIKLPELQDKMVYIVNSDEVVQNKRADSYYYQPKFKEVEKAIKKGKFEVKELKYIAEKLESGQRPKGGVRQISEGVPSLGGEHVLRDGTIATSDLKFIPMEFHKKQLKSKVQRKDIIIVKDGATTGKIGIVPEDYPFEEVNINEHVFLMRVKQEANPYFVFSILKSQLGQMQINRDITGGTIMGIIRETTEAIKIPLPFLAVQNKIAEEVKKRMQKAEQLQKEAKEELEKAKQEVEKLIEGK